MSAHNTKNPEPVRGGDRDRPNVSKGTRPEHPERERLRDMIVVIVTYPLTPTKEAHRLAEKKPWLEFVSLLLKVGLALYALYEAAFR